ncbi:hypothetical protein OAT48_04985 [Gammaproteobacteria bacterium]|nr:hypothetical protein [Gammaproteobacteria bacterium]
MSWIKVIAINIIITFSLLGLLLLTPSFVFYVSQIAKTFNGFSETDSRASLDLYSEYEWANNYFIESSEISTTYFDFITWRRDDYRGNTININNGIRKTINTSNHSSSRFWFFGGSTTWGTGVNDEFTYPSLFAQSTSYHATNFGETGYIARQSLAYLNNHLIRNNIQDLTNIKIVFYDGVNDVLHRCRREISSLGTGRENQIQNMLYSSGGQKFGLSRTFSQLQDFLVSVFNKIFPDPIGAAYAKENYVCATNRTRAIEIAESLVNTWQIASDLVISRGGDFTAILQPVAFIGNSDISYLELNSLNDRSLAAQYKAVYPLIIEIATKRNIRFVDLTSTYDQCTNCYIDFCHTGPQGHERLTRRLVSLF